MPDDEYLDDGDVFQPDEPDWLADYWKHVQNWYGEDAGNLPENFIQPLDTYPDPTHIRYDPYVSVDDLLEYIGTRIPLHLVTILTTDEGFLYLAVGDS